MAQPTADWRQVELFGGAITVQLPQRLGDISDVRPVPDHQEVWADPATDQSVIIEITEHSPVPDSEVGQFVFADLAAVNEATDSNITSIQQLDHAQVPHMPQGNYMCLVTGTQMAAKGRDQPRHANSVLVLLAVLRLPKQQSDLLVTVNAPLFVSPGSTAGIAAGAQPAAQAQAAQLMQGVLSTLNVQDWSLFGAADS